LRHADDHDRCRAGGDLRLPGWNPQTLVDANTLPSAGRILAALSQDRVGDEDYDRVWRERAKQSLW
jgi:hypothetical protein